MCMTWLCFSTSFLFKIFRLHSLCILHGAGGGGGPRFEGEIKQFMSGKSGDLIFLWMYRTVYM